LTVYLSDFAVRQFEALKARNEQRERKSDWVFPARLKEGASLSETTIGKQIRGRQRGNEKRLKGRTEQADSLMLPGGQWKCHDMRRTGATLMQSLGVLPDIIHRCRNHARGSKLDRICLQHDYSAEMAEAWLLLGERLDLLTRSDADNVTIPGAA
jgi:integrase